MTTNDMYVPIKSKDILEGTPYNFMFCCALSKGKSPNDLFLPILQECGDLDQLRKFAHENIDKFFDAGQL
jgi:hypothetical protein